MVEPRRGSQLEYVCDVCGQRQPAGQRGLQPAWWFVVQVPDFGRAHACSDICRVRARKGAVMANLPDKILVEYYETVRGLGSISKKKLLWRFTLTEVKSRDDALRRAKERAALEGRRVMSANFRADESGQLDSIVAYVEARK